MGLRVLVVEDDVVNRRYLGEWLISHGHDCLLTATLSEAAEALKRRRFDLCIADVHLGDGNGRNLAELMPQHTRLVLMSGDPAEGEQRWLQKPLSAHSLALTLDGIPPTAGLADPLPPAHLPDLDDRAASNALGAGISVLSGLRQLLCGELRQDRQRLSEPLDDAELATIQERLHRLVASSALCGLPRLHSASHHLHRLLQTQQCHHAALAEWHEAAARALGQIQDS